MTVLLLWLFALGSGWANACLLQDRGTHVPGPADSASLVAQAPIVSAGHVGADSDHEGNQGAGKPACLKVCDDGTQTIVKLPSTFDLPDAALAPPAAFEWTTQLVAASAARSVLALPAPGPALPLRTRLSRLAL